MPPRRPSHRKDLPLTFASATESVEARVKRLRLVSGGPCNAVAEETRVGTPRPGVASSSPSVAAPIMEGLRSDVPLVRNLRRGSFADAAAALAQSGAGGILH